MFIVIYVILSFGEMFVRKLLPSIEVGSFSKDWY